MWKFGFCILAITSSVFNILDSSSSTQSTKDILLKCPTEHFPFVAISKALDHTNKNCNLYNSLRVTKNLKYSPNSKVQLYLIIIKDWSRNVGHSTLYALPADVTSIHTVINMRVYILTVYVIPDVTGPNRKVQLYLCLLLIANSSDILKQILALELLDGIGTVVGSWPSSTNCVSFSSVGRTITYNVRGPGI
jgi:hypothetical protein